jgi:hypothetical protein
LLQEKIDITKGVTAAQSKSIAEKLGFKGAKVAAVRLSFGSWR